MRLSNSVLLLPPLILFLHTCLSMSSPLAMHSTLDQQKARTQHFSGTRITIHSSQNFTAVMAKLYSEIGSPTTLQYPLIAKNITSYNSTSKAAFVAAVTKAVGPHGFMLFQEFNHGSWLPLFSLSVALGLKRLILGNPLIAVTMLEHDLTAGLFVPVELLVREIPLQSGGGTDLVYVLPSALIAGVYDNRSSAKDHGSEKKGGEMEDLLDAATLLDEKVMALVDFVAT